ncbi:hypothetical protein COU74_01390 [Candidatus Peregrinibacteria bacterium CG10_big_fil_rev_8_21_14_0_10_36_19]|nr:MAG: hypothetical protein COU74_01390 [Candidatus Peregrinibacteria bacterium CG10_big_fil_rev_8_21_14_0_10_36_19]
MKYSVPSHPVVDNALRKASVDAPLSKWAIIGNRAEKGEVIVLSNRIRRNLVALDFYRFAFDLITKVSEESGGVRSVGDEFDDLYDVLRGGSDVSYLKQRMGHKIGDLGLVGYLNDQYGEVRNVVTSLRSDLASCLAQVEPISYDDAVAIVQYSDALIYDLDADVAQFRARLRNVADQRRKDMFPRVQISDI